MPDAVESNDTIGDLVEEELASTAQAVETAALRIQQMLLKSREDDTGVKLEVNERLLDSCTGLMMAIKILIARSKDLQSEIVGEGMVSMCGIGGVERCVSMGERWQREMVIVGVALGGGVVGVAVGTVR